ncbi:glycosyltransferase family 2 protein [Flavobacteriales bacterium]|nr:glycosyltransferase family 2 protein [Flavobacteriales bacterium]
MSVLISVLNYNNYKSTKKCIYSILKSNYKNFEILIIDNKSLDDSFTQLKKEFKEIKCKQSTINGGYAAGHKISVNFAIKNNFDFIWILNNDLTVSKNALKELINAYNRTGIGLYGSITLKSENPDIINFGGGITDNITDPLNYNDFEDFTLEKYNNSIGNRKVQSIEGSSFLIPIEIIKKHGFMREDFFMYGEETDYCYSLNKKGISSYLITSSIAIHKGAESLRYNKNLESYYRRRNFLYFQKDHYNISVFKNLKSKEGIFNIIKYFVRFIFFSSLKENQYYINLANIHALFNVRGKLK